MRPGIQLAVRRAQNCLILQEQKLTAQVKGLHFFLISRIRALLINKNAQGASVPLLNSLVRLQRHQSLSQSPVPRSFFQSPSPEVPAKMLVAEYIKPSHRDCLESSKALIIASCTVVPGWRCKRCTLNTL